MVAFRIGGVTGPTQLKALYMFAAGAVFRESDSDKI